MTGCSNGLQVTPIAGAMGAEIGGVTLAGLGDPAVFADIRRALLDHLMIVFRDQQLDPAEQVAFSRKFGPYGPVPFVKPLDEHPEVIAVIREADERSPAHFGGSWHSDFSFQAEPPLGSILYAREVPPYGGDTLFANMYMAYETLSGGMQALLADLKALHSATRAYGSKAGRGLSNLKGMTISRGPDGDAVIEHPLVRTHPETGRKALFVNPVYTVGIAGLRPDESAPILDYLYRHAVRPEFTCRLAWRKGTLAFWDNRCTQHLALNDFYGFRREMHRTTVAGDRPA